MYRIYTENVNAAAIDAIIAKRFESWTEIPSVGYWHGQKENSLIIEIETDDRSDVEAVAEDIRAANNQQAVMVSHIQSESTLVTEVYPRQDVKPGYVEYGEVGAAD